MKYLRYTVAFNLLLMLLLPAFGQTKIIQQLKADMEKSPPGKARLNPLFLLCAQFRSMPVDTLLYYASFAKKIAEDNADTYDAAKANYYIGVAYVKKGNLDTVFLLADGNLKSLKKEGIDEQLQIDYIFLKAQAFMRGSRYKEAMSQYLEMLHRAENINDTLRQIKALSGAGWVNMELSHYTESLSWLLRAIQTGRDEKLLQHYPIVYSNTSSVYNNLYRFDSAFYFAKKAVSVSTQVEDLSTLANALNIEADIYINTKKNNLAEIDLNRALEIRKQIGDPFYVVSDMGQLAGFYAETGDTKKGINIAKEGIAIAASNNLGGKLPYLYNALALNYKAASDYKNYGLTQEKIINLKDSLYQKNSADALAEIQTKYELQKKENTIIQQKLDLVTKNYWLYASLILFIFITLLAFVIFQDYKKRQKIKMQAALAEEKRMNTASIQAAEENERRRIAADLHDNLGVYAASIVANLDTVSAEKEFNNNTISALQELNSNSQSIVSQLGDTIWALKRSALSLTAVSDRIKLVLQKVQPSYINIKMDVVEKIDKDFQLSPSQGFHLFQIIQEAVINALKHSNCSEMKVIFITDESWQVCAEDNGTGIKTTVSNKGGGNGLQNMLQRSKEAGFIIEWQANEPAGTKVIVRPTTN